MKRIVMEPYDLSPAFFNQRMKGIDAETSAAIFEELKAVGVVLEDNQSHFGRYETWCDHFLSCMKILRFIELGWHFCSAAFLQRWCDRLSVQPC